MNILLVAEDAAGLRTLQSVRQTNHQIVAVMSSPSRQGDTRASLWSLAAQLGYATWPAQLVGDRTFAEKIRQHQVDIILNVHSLFLICKEVLEAPSLGSYNLHPGPLPRYAGLNSVCWAIYRGETTYGVSLHRIEPGIDTGPIVSQQVFEIGNEETGLTLATKCVNIGIPMILQFLDATQRNPLEILEVSQDLNKREYFGREVPEDGNLSWRRPAQQIFNFVRSCDFAPFNSPWGHPRTTLRDSELGIGRVELTRKPAAAPPGTVGEVNEFGVEVACADEWILVRRVLKGGKYVSAATMLKTGDRFDDSTASSS